MAVSVLSTKLGIMAAQNPLTAPAATGIAIGSIAGAIGGFFTGGFLIINNIFKFRKLEK